jgi:hypothetical protein
MGILTKSRMEMLLVMVAASTAHSRVTNQPPDFVVCAGSVMGILALFFIKRTMTSITDSTSRGESL